MSNSKKIIVIGTMSSYLYNFRKDLIKYLIKLGHEVYALTTDDDPKYTSQIKSLGVTHYTYPMDRGGVNPVSDFSSIKSLYKHINAIKPDVVFSYTTKPVIFGTIAAKMAKVPNIVGMIEGLGYTFTEQPIAETKKTKLIRAVQVLLYKTALPLADNIIFLNPDDPKDLLDTYDISVKKSHIVGGIGLDMSEYPFQPYQHTDKVNFLFIGRLLREKGIYEFIEAAKQVKLKYNHAKFTVLGSLDTQNPGALSEIELKQLINTGLIEYPGHVDNIAEWLNKCAVFVLPSYREGVPRSTQEAMAIGRAVITTDVPGCRETVIDGDNGFLVTKWNPKPLAEKMIYFIENPTQIIKMGERSHEIAKEKFDVNTVNQKLANIILS
ncbi:MULTISPECIES: glycosyltransferase family 4 protein [unclassified Moraxella]|uniref:glycosyltransferase family 4 protein n=1 Tax=unclassified Moraxella TaxID=2685852 RepID=UPI003AF6F300